MNIKDSLVKNSRQTRSSPYHNCSIEMVRKISSGSYRSWEPVKEKLSKRKTQWAMTLVMITQVSMCVGGRSVIGNNQVNNLSFQYTVYPSLLDDDDDEVEEVDGVDGNVIVL